MYYIYSINISTRDSDIADFCLQHSKAVGCEHRGKKAQDLHQAQVAAGEETGAHGVHLQQ